MKIFEKIKAIPAKTKGVIVGFGSAVGSMAAASFNAFAEGTNEGVSAAQSLLNTATQTLNITNMVAIVGAGIGAVLGLMLAWWGARKLFAMLKNAAFKGGGRM